MQPDPLMRWDWSLAKTSRSSFSISTCTAIFLPLSRKTLNGPFIWFYAFTPTSTSHNSFPRILRPVHSDRPLTAVGVCRRRLRDTVAIPIETVIGWLHCAYGSFLRLCWIHGHLLGFQPTLSGDSTTNSSPPYYHLIIRPEHSWQWFELRQLRPDHLRRVHTHH